MRGVGYLDLFQPDTHSSENRPRPPGVTAFSRERDHPQELL